MHQRNSMKVRIHFIKTTVSIFLGLLLTAASAWSAPIDQEIRAAAGNPAPPVAQGPSRFNFTSKGTEHPENEVALINDGVTSYEIRLRMIQSAEQEIDIEAYEFAPDGAGKTLLRALIAKKAEMDAAHKPFRIRLLIDPLNAVQTTSGPKIDANMAQEILKRGIDFKFYNEGPNIDHRDHKKIMLVDGKQYITGGRNMTDKYFGFDAKANYMDSDIYVRGNTAGAAQGAFNAFWDASFTDRPAPPHNPSGDITASKPAAAHLQQLAIRAYQASLQAATTFAHDLDYGSPELTALRQRIDTQGGERLASIRITPAREVTFLSDQPGEGVLLHNVANKLVDKIHDAQKSVILENWTFLPSDREHDAFDSALGHKVPVTVLTNSLNSGGIDPNDMVTAQVSYPDQVHFAQANLGFFDLQGHNSREEGITAEVTRSSLWATHAKRGCVDHTDCLISSCNLDPRSAERNSEVGVLVENNPDFARQVEASIQERINDAAALTPAGQYVSATEYLAGKCPCRILGPTPEQLAQLTGAKYLLERATRDFR